MNKKIQLSLVLNESNADEFEIAEKNLFEMISQIEEDDDLSEEELYEDSYLNEADDSETPTTEDYKKMSEEDLKVESLKIATNIAKLMSDVTTDDIIIIADKVASFIRNHDIDNNEETTKENIEDDEEKSEEEKND